MLLKLISLLSVMAAAGIALGTGLWWLLPVAFIGIFVGCILIAFLLAWVPSLFVDPDKSVEEESKYFRTLARLYAPAVFSLLLTKIEITGGEKLPRNGRFMLVCNHLDNLDSGVILAAFPDSQLAFVAKKETADMFLIGKLMKKILCQHIDRENDRAALRTILKCISIIKEDKASFVAFPEGGVIEDGKLLHHFRHGVFKIAQKANVPIVVCTIQGTRQVLKNIRRLKRSTVQLHLLDVIPAEDLKGVTTVDIGNRVHKMMAEDLGAENVALDM